MITIGAMKLRHHLGELMNHLDAGDHIRVTRRGHSTGVMVPETWYQEAARAMSIVDGLARMGEKEKSA